MFIKTLVHQKKKWFFLLLFLFLAIPLWLFEAPDASAHPTSGGPSAIQHAHAQKAFLHAAVFCSGKGCDHHDPYASGCAASFYEVAAVSTKSLRVELEYSPLCDTNWTQIYELNRRPGYLRGGVHRSAGIDGSKLDVAFQSRSFWWIDTDMVFAPHNLAMACGTNMDPTIPGPLYGICTDWY